MKAKEARAIFPFRYEAPVQWFDVLFRVGSPAWWAWAGIIVFRWVARLLPFLRYRPPDKNDLIFGVEKRVLREIPS